MKRSAKKVCALLITLSLYSGTYKLNAQPNISNTNERKVKNLTAFAKSYGYIRFFYPNTQTKDFDWDAFLVYGVQQVRELKTNEELRTALSNLFLPIAPYILFSEDENIVLEAKPISQGDSITFWQHSSFSIGENMGAKSEGNNIRILVTTAYDPIKIIQADNPLLKDEVQFELIAYSNFNKYYYPGNFKPSEFSDEYVLDKQPNPLLPFSSKLTDNLWITTPIALGHQQAKHLSQKTKIEKFSNVIKEFYSNEKLVYQENNIWYADFILVWNAFHHLYPYRKRSEKMFNFQSSEQLIISLNKISNSTDKKSTSLRVVKNYVSLFQDGHADAIRQHTPDKKNQDSKTFKNVRSWLPFYRIYSQGKVYVLRSFDPKIRSGDELLEINNLKVSSLLDSEIKGSLASRQLNLWNAVSTIGSLLNTSKAVVKLKRDNEEILTVSVNTISQKEYFKHFKNPFEHKPFEYPSPGIIYINPSLLSPNDLKDNLDEIIKAKHLIFDLRIYPNSLRDIFDHIPVDYGLGKGLIISSPLNMYPNQEQQYHIWESPLTISKSPFINAKISILISSTTMSRGETFASYFKYIGARLVGDSNTAGASGGIDWFTTPGKIKIWLTASFAVRQNGDEMQSVGITPDILVQHSLKELKEGKDQVYEATLKIIQQE